MRPNTSNGELTLLLGGDALGSTTRVQRQTTLLSADVVGPLQVVKTQRPTSVESDGGFVPHGSIGYHRASDGTSCAENQSYILTSSKTGHNDAKVNSKLSRDLIAADVDRLLCRTERAPRLTTDRHTAQLPRVI